MKFTATVLAIVIILSVLTDAQTITVDASHSTNHFVPSETLGAGVDRIPAEAIDKGKSFFGRERNLSGHFFRPLAGGLHWIVARRRSQGRLLLPLSALADGARLQQLSGDIRHVHG